MSPLLGTLKNIVVTPLGCVATFHLVSFLGDPRERRGYVAIQPIFGPQEGKGDVAIFVSIPFLAYLLEHSG